MDYEFTKQSQSARSAILAKLKKQVEGADYDKLPAEETYQYGKLSKEQMLDQFVNSLTNNHAQVIKTDEREIASVIFEQLKQRDIKSLLYGENTTVAELLCKDLARQAETDIRLIPFDFKIGENKQAYFNDMPASVTSSRWSIAETGTIVLWPTEQEPRTMSLVPPVHIVVVDAETLHSNFASLVKQQKWSLQMPTNVLLVSGPSKTADIQQTLAFGAHGPKELIVLLINCS